MGTKVQIHGATMVQSTIRTLRHESGEADIRVLTLRIAHRGETLTIDAYLAENTATNHILAGLEDVTREDMGILPRMV